MREERRRHQRIKLPNPLRGTIGKVRLFVLDLSIGGVRVAHQDDLPAVGTNCTLHFDTAHGPVILDCVLAHTGIYRRAASAMERTVYHSGLQIVSAREGSDRVLREIIAYCVERALDEQKANARGIPATAALSFQTGKGTDYYRFDLRDGTWRRTATRDPKQPQNGFTVSAEESEESIAMLCEAYSTGGADGRKMIRVMAEMSISKSEGIPTRRYEP